MCVDHDARLPALPPGTHSFTAERTELTAADGTRLLARVARPDDSTTDAPGVVILPDVRGLFAFYEDLADQFAAHGRPAVAIDYFGRTAGTGHRDEDFPFMDHIAQITSPGMHADIAAAVDLLTADAPDRRVYTVGFCFGGNMAWAAASHPHGLAGAVGFYGKPEADRPAGDGPIWDRCHLIEAPVIGLFGGADPGIPQEAIDRFEQALSAAGVDHEVVTYPGAPHSFFDRSQADHTEASLDAWHRMEAFIR